jgi:SAM-dependent methyltransferase
MKQGADSYLFSPAWERERARLGALETAYDPITVRHLTALGVGPGWHCLEVGGGAGSIARWLAAAVGDTGSVLVTDLDVRFLEDLASDRIEVVRHDIRSDPLDDGAFDLVHARAVLEHLSARDEVLPRLVEAVRPGGVLLVEDALLGGPSSRALEPGVVPPEMGPLVTKGHDAFGAGFRAIGADPEFGIKLHGRLLAAGLEDVDAEVCSRLLHGGSERAPFYVMTFEQAGSRLVEAGLLTADELERALAYFRDPASCWMSLALVSAWGRRPAASG